MRTIPEGKRGTVAVDDLVDVATADLDRAEQGMARGALLELNALKEQRANQEKRHSADRQSSEHSQTPSARSANIPSIRNGVARILNAAAEAVEEYLDVEEDEDKVPEIPEVDRFEGMRERVESFITQVEQSSPLPDRRSSLDSKDSLSQRGASLRSRGQSLKSQTKSIPGVERSSTEQFNEKVRSLGAQTDSPFLRAQLQSDPISAPTQRRLLRSDPIAFDKRSNTSFEIMGRDKVRDSILSEVEPRSAFGLPPRIRPKVGANPTRLRAPIRHSDEVPNRAVAYVPYNDPTHRLSLGSAPSQGLGTIEEVRVGDAGQLVRRRIALPWQTTLLFGCVTVVGCLCGMTTLGIAIRNLIYLNGPKAGPQIPDVIKGIDQILGLLNDPQLNLSSGR